MEKDYAKKATDPLQYDSENMRWEKDGSHNSPSRLFFKEYLKKAIDVKNKSVLDIGSGTGQLFSFLRELGASQIEGVEPSKYNVDISKKLNPQIRVLCGTVDKYPANEQFDVIIMVMVFEHIKDVDQMFSKIKNLLKSGGYFYTIVGDKKYHTTPRHGYELDVADIGNEEVATKTLYQFGLLYDIFRPLKNYIRSATRNGLVLDISIELKPTELFMTLDPRYRDFSDTTICHLLSFKKN